MRPYYADDACTIYHGDCREVLPTLSFDALVTDPPYNIGYGYASYDDTKTADQYEAFTREWFCPMADKPAVVFPGLANLSLWCRIQKPTAVGCWHMPGNPGRGFPWSFIEWEPILLYNARMFGGSNVLRYPTKTLQRGVGDHPCPKPLPLIRDLVRRQKGEVVCDPFMGSGTTLRAAKDLGVRGIGIEIEEAYCEIAAKRLAQEVLAL